MKKLLCMLLVLVFLLPCISCTQDARSERSFFLMDTVITVTLYEDAAVSEPIFAACNALLAELDRLWSRTVETSDISRWNASSDGAVDLDARTLELIRLSQEVSRKTDGAFDITVLPYVLLWERAAERGSLPTDTERAAAAALVGYGKLTVSADGVAKEIGAQIDLGGIGKGAAISALISYLEGSGARGGVVSFGSNVAVFGAKPDRTPFRIALRDPESETAHAGVLTLAPGEILSVSGDYERYHTIGGERYHHILDPHTAYPAATGLSSVAVVCSDGALADALSTALFVMGYERAMELYRSDAYDFEAVFITDTGEILLTDGMDGKFETKK